MGTSSGQASCVTASPGRPRRSRRVGARLDGAGRGDDGDATARGGRGGHGAGPNDADNRHRRPLPHSRQSAGGGRVAGEHEQLHVLAQQPVDRLEREAPHLVGRARAVRRAPVVAEVDRGFVRQAPAKLGENGESPDAGVEDADRLGSPRSARSARDGSAAHERGETVRVDGRPESRRCGGRPARSASRGWR